MKESAEEIRKIEGMLATEKMSEPILPGVRWNVVTFASMIFSLVVPGGIYLVRSGRHRQAKERNE